MADTISLALNRNTLIEVLVDGEFHMDIAWIDYSKAKDKHFWSVGMEIWTHPVYVPEEALQLICDALSESDNGIEFSNYGPNQDWDAYQESQKPVTDHEGYHPERDDS